MSKQTSLLHHNSSDLVVEIPVIDFSSFFTTSSLSVKQVVARKVIEETTKGRGFFYAKNVGFTEREISVMFDLSHKFFSLPSEIKNRTKNNNHKNIQQSIDLHKRGYIPVEQDIQKDNKEAFDVGTEANILLENQERPNDNEEVIKNIQDLQMNLLSSAFFKHAREAAMIILEAFAIGLGVDPNFFRVKSMGQDNETTLRFIHYPPMDYPIDDTLRAKAHTDYGSITLLWQDGQPGLEIWDPKWEKWLAIKAITGPTCIVNTGDMMMRWTNNKLLSTCHRVRAVPEKNDRKLTREKYNIAFYVHPDNDVIIEPFPICRDDNGQTAIYQPVSVRDFLHCRIQEHIGNVVV